MQHHTQTQKDRSLNELAFGPFSANIATYILINPEHSALACAHISTNETIVIHTFINVLHNML